MTSAIAHRIPRPLSVLTALAALALSAPLALVGTPGHAAPTADENSLSFKGSMDIVVNSDQPLFGAVVSSGDTGSWVAPLESMTGGETPPLAAELDPGLH